MASARGKLKRKKDSQLSPSTHNSVVSVFLNCNSFREMVSFNSLNGGLYLINVLQKWSNELTSCIDRKYCSTAYDIELDASI